MMSRLQRGAKAWRAPCGCHFYSAFDRIRHHILRWHDGNRFLFTCLVARLQTRNSAGA